MVAQINFSVDDKMVSVAPGASVELGVTVQNLTTLLDQVTVRLEGIEPTWVQVIPPQLPVFAQSQAIARVVVQPPYDLAQSVAGLYPLRVTGLSQENPEQVGDTGAELEIQHTGEYQAELGAGKQTGEAGAFEILVRYKTNAPLETTFHAGDEHDALWYKFEPFQLLISPGAQAQSRLQVRPKQIRANLREVEFTMVIEGEYLLRGGTRIEANPQTLAAAYQVPAPQALRLDIKPVLNGHSPGKSYEVRVDNPAALPVTVHLSGQANEGLFDFEFVPAQLTVAPQSQGSAHVTVQPVSTLTHGRTEMFRVLALPEDDALEPVSVEGAFIADSQPAVAPVLYTEDPVQEPLPERRGFPWIALLSGALSFIITFLVALSVALVSGWSP